MTDFIKLTQITEWKIDNDKKEPTSTKVVYVRPQDIVSFGDDDGTTLVQFTDKGIHVKESAEEIYEMIHGYKLTYRGNPIREYKNKEYFDDQFWWNTDWWRKPAGRIPRDGPFCSLRRRISSGLSAYPLFRSCPGSVTIRWKKQCWRRSGKPGSRQRNSVR